MKSIVITKNSTELWGIRIITFVAVVACGWTAYTSHDAMIYLLMCAPAVPLLLLLLYYETWKIEIAKSGIIYRVLLHRYSYAYNQLLDVTASYSLTAHSYIKLHFADGKECFFRKEDENAEKAINKICRHKSIRNAGLK